MAGGGGRAGGRRAVLDLGSEEASPARAGGNDRLAKPRNRRLPAAHTPRAHARAAPVLGEMRLRGKAKPEALAPGQEVPPHGSATQRRPPVCEANLSRDSPSPVAPPISARLTALP